MIMRIIRLPSPQREERKNPARIMETAWTGAVG